MAKSGNTWVKKQRAADKRAIRKIKGIKNRFAVDTPPPVYDAAARAKRADALGVLPVKVGYAPKGFGKRHQSGSRMSPSKRAMVEARTHARAEFFASLGAQG